MKYVQEIVIASCAKTLAQCKHLYMLFLLVVCE